MLSFTKYPACLLFYSLSLGAVVEENWQALRRIFDLVIVREHRDDQRAVELLAMWNLHGHSGQVMQILPGRERQYTPLQMHMMELLLPMVREHFASDHAFDLAFDRLEMLVALSFAAPVDRSQKFTAFWAPIGAWGWRTGNRERIFKELRSQLSSGGPLVPLIGRDAAHATENLKQLEDFAAKLGMW